MLAVAGETRVTLRSHAPKSFGVVRFHKAFDRSMDLTEAPGRAPGVRTQRAVKAATSCGVSVFDFFVAAIGTALAPVRVCPARACRLGTVSTKRCGH